MVNAITLGGVEPSVRCADFARAEGVDPIGSAGSYSGYLLTTLPLPWPKDVSQAESIAALVGEAEANGWRLQALAPAEPDERVTIRYRGPTGPFAGFLTDDIDERMVLVCTHGSRDTCCGSRGTTLWRKLPAMAGVRVRRTSHTGGHRFAPTAVILPEGTVWAFLDEDLLAGIVERTVPVERALPHYRGCSGLPGAEAQAADREALGRHGWAWLDTPRTATIEAQVEGRAFITIEGGGARHHAVVERGRCLPVPDCGRPIEAAKKSEWEYRVASFTTT